MVGPNRLPKHNGSVPPLRPQPAPATPADVAGGVDLGASQLRDRVREIAMARLRDVFPKVPQVSEVLAITYRGNDPTKVDVAVVRGEVEKRYWNIVSFVRGLGAHESEGDFELSEGVVSMSPDGMRVAQFALTWKPRDAGVRPPLSIVSQ